MEKKSKTWNRGKQTQMPVTLTEGLAATDKGFCNRRLFLQGNSVNDVWWDSKCDSSEKVSTAGVKGYTRESWTPPAF